MFFKQKFDKIIIVQSCFKKPNYFKTIASIKVIINEEKKYTYM